MVRHRRPPSREVRRRRTVLVAAVVVAGCVALGLGLVVDRGSTGASAKALQPGGRVPATPRQGTSSTSPSAATTDVSPVSTVRQATTTTSPTSTSAASTSVATTGANPTLTTVPLTSGGLVLAGKTVAIDPGHNGDNFTDASYIDHLIWNGRSYEACDTTGTETDAGYTEALFNFQVAGYLAADLQAEGATTVLTRLTNTGIGPCVNERAAIGNDAHANAAISIHADGGPANGRGFTVLEPVADTINDAIIGPSAILGSAIRSAMLSENVEPVSDYYGTDGLQPRDDLGGLNLSTVPKVLVECANMRNASDAALIVTPAWQQQVARALAAGITSFLESAPDS